VPPDADPAAPQVFAYLTVGAENQVVRFTLGSSDVTPILTGIPAASNHNGGRIAFGPDGLLYVGTGDATESGLAQDHGSLAGKILRITSDGQAAPGNPFAGSPVYSLGHRNVQGLAWDAQGRLYATEFGQNTFDEVNLIQPGGNYGWPTVEGQGGDSRFVEPVVTWATSEASPSGGVILAGGRLPGWEGDMLVAALRGARLWRLDFNADGSVAGQEALLTGEYGRLRTVAQAPDGSVWVATSNRDGRGDPTAEDDRILRIVPA
jgi:glucose/arabinose dehydrogenase